MNEIDVLKRLENLPYLSVLRSRNISILSKSNNFHDSVKFFAQIDDKNVIKKISFKASGCTAFMLMCSYFCELVEGKKISTALKINVEDLEKLMTLKDSQKHVVDIITKTFALMINKYNKGVAKGTIIPIKSDDSESKDEIAQDKVLIVDNTAKTKKSSKTTKEVKNSTKSVKKSKSDVVDNNEVVIVEPKKADTGYKTIETIETKQVYVDHNDNKITEHVVTQKTIVETNDSNKNESTQIIVDDNHHKVHDVSEFSSMMDRLNKTKSNGKNINSLKANLSKIHVKNNQIIEERKTVTVEVEKPENEKKSKKGLFSWFLKK